MSATHTRRPERLEVVRPAPTPLPPGQFQRLAHPYDPEQLDRIEAQLSTIAKQNVEILRRLPAVEPDDELQVAQDLGLDPVEALRQKARRDRAATL